MQAYEKVLQMAPDHLEAMVNLGTIRERMGDAIEAERLYRKALALNPMAGEWQPVPDGGAGAWGAGGK